MKVGLIVPGFSADAGDWCIPVLVDVVRELSRRAEVHVFALRYPPGRARYAVHGAEVHALGGDVIRGLRRPGLLSAACAAVVAEHRRAPFAALHGLWADEPGFVAVTAARLLRIPAFVSVMGGELVAMPDIDYGGRLSASNRLLSALALRRAGRVTAGSNGAVELARRLSRQPGTDARVARLVWGIDPCLFEPADPPLHLAGDRRVLHVGSLVPVKDQGTLLRAVARVSGAEPGVHLHVVGDGPLRSALADEAQRLGIEKCVTFHGQVNRRELRRFYRAADVVAVSSRWEAQSVVALEAALCGAPIVGTAVGLVADLAPGEAIAVPVGDDCRLAEAILAALRPEGGRRLGAAARGLVGAQYLAAHTADGLLGMYRNGATARAA